MDGPNWGPQVKLFGPYNQRKMEITTTNPMTQPDAFGNYYQPGLLQSPYHHLYHNRKTRAKEKHDKFIKRAGVAAATSHATDHQLSEKSSSQQNFYLYDDHDTERRIENIRNNKAIFRYVWLPNMIKWK